MYPQQVEMIGIPLKFCKQCVESLHRYVLGFA